MLGWHKKRRTLQCPTLRKELIIYVSKWNYCKWLQSSFHYGGPTITVESGVPAVSVIGAIDWSTSVSRRQAAESSTALKQTIRIMLENYKSKFGTRGNKENSVKKKKTNRKK